MATFPESPVPFYPLEVVEIWDTLVSRMESGTEQRRQRQLFPIYDVTVTYDVLSAADCETLWQFYSARKGAYEAFYIYDLALLAGVSFSHKAQYCGTGNGTIDTFDIPGRSTSSQTIYLDGASQASGYSILTGGGASNADRVQFTTPPASGQERRLWLNAAQAIMG